MDRERLDRGFEWGILGLVLALLVYSPLAFGGTRMLEFLGIQWLAVALAALWLGRLWISQELRLFWHPVCWAVLAFMIYAAVRYLTAEVEFIARQEMIRVLVYGLLFFIIVNNLHRQETIQIIGLTLVFVAMAVSLYAVYQYLTGSEYVLHVIKPRNYIGRASGTWICPNHLAGYLEMVLPLALAYTLFGRFSPPLRILLAYTSLAIFAGILTSVSRGGWVACAASLCVLFYWRGRQQNSQVPAVLIGTGLSLAAAFFVAKGQLAPGRFENVSLEGITHDIRFRLWPSAVEMWRNHFWWGAGPGHFDVRYPKYRPAEFDFQTRPERAHNDYLNTLADWGLIGAALVTAAWGLFFWGVFRCAKAVQQEENDFDPVRSNQLCAYMGGVVGLVAVLFHSLVDFNMHVPSNAILAVTLMALVCGLFRVAKPDLEKALGRRERTVVLLGLAAALVYLAQQSIQRSIEQWWLQAAAREAKHSPEQATVLRKAFAIEPRNFQTAYDIGESFRLQSWHGQEGYQDLAREAIQWYQHGLRANPLMSEAYIRHGMCLDWLGQHAGAGPMFQKAVALDPNGYWTLAHMGWHCFQVSDYAKAQIWLEMSCRLCWNENLIGRSYLQIVQERRAEERARRQLQTPPTR